MAATTQLEPVTPEYVGIPKGQSASDLTEAQAQALEEHPEQRAGPSVSIEQSPLPPPPAPSIPDIVGRWTSEHIAGPVGSFLRTPVTPETVSSFLKTPVLPFSFLPSQSAEEPKSLPPNVERAPELDRPKTEPAQQQEPKLAAGVERAPELDLSKAPESAKEAQPTAEAPKLAAGVERAPELDKPTQPAEAPQLPPAQPLPGEARVTPSGPTAAEADEDAKYLQMRQQIAQGQSPGAAQATADGKQPATVAQKPSEQVQIPTSNSDYTAPAGAHDFMGIKKEVWQNVMSEEGPGFSVDPGTNHMSVFGLWQGTPDVEGQAYNVAHQYGANSLEAYNAVTAAWTKKFLGQSQPWKLTSPGLQALVIADSQHVGGGAARTIIDKMGGWDAINKMDPKQAIAEYTSFRYPLWKTNAGRVVREGKWALKYNDTIASGAAPDMSADTSKLIMPPSKGGAPEPKGAPKGTAKGGDGGEGAYVPVVPESGAAPGPAQIPSELRPGEGGGGALRSAAAAAPEPSFAMGRFGFPQFGGGRVGVGGEEAEPRAPVSTLATTQQMKPANVLSAQTVAPPPAPGLGPSGLAQLALPSLPTPTSNLPAMAGQGMPAQGMPSIALPALAQGMKPANVLGVRTVGRGPAPPPAPGGALPGRAALALPAPGRAAPPAPGLAPRAPTPAAPTPTKPAPTPAPARPVAPQRPGVPAPAGGPTVGGIRLEGGPRGSTIGIPNPPGSEAIAQHPKVADRLKAHAVLISPDDPRVKKQEDGYTKGEHFVPGDVMHEELLGGLPGGHGGRQRQLLGEGERAIAERRPMHISYISAPKEALKFPTRESRQIQYEKHSPEARLLGKESEGIGQLVGHSMIPVAVGITPSKTAGEPHQGVIHGISTNTIANNVHHVNTVLKEMGRASPYPRLSPKLFTDLEGYVSNLNAGHKGTGEGYALGTREYPNEPDRGHIPYRLTRGEADYLNLIINNTMAFPKHARGQALRELARVNGTLITPEGETNPLRFDIEQHRPGWAIERAGKRPVLEPSIKSFNAGLIHEIHAHPEEMRESIRPGREYQQLTESLARTSPRGRPDVPMAVGLETGGFVPPAPVPQFVFSPVFGGMEPLAHHMQEGGLVAEKYKIPALSDEEHQELAGNIRKQFLSGKLKTAEYLERMKDVPEPGAEFHHEEEPEGYQVGGMVAPAQAQGNSNGAGGPQDTDPSSQFGIVPEEEHPPQPPAPAPAPQAQAAPPAPIAPPKPKPVKAPATPLPVAQGEPIAKPSDWKAAPEHHRQAYLEQKVANTLQNQYRGPETHELEVQRKEDGGVKYDPQGNPIYVKHDYDIANSPLLKKKGLNQIANADKHEDTLDIRENKKGEFEGADKMHAHLNQVERRRLSAMRNASAVETMGDKIAESFHSMKDIPEIMAGQGWYSRMRKKLRKALGKEHHELFAQLLGATSAKTPVRNNFIQALDALEQFKEGKFDNHIKKYLEAYNMLKANGKGSLSRYMKDQGIQLVDSKGNKVDMHKSDAEAMSQWIAHHDILPMQKLQPGATERQKYNANSEAVLKVLAGTWLKEVDAPKTPNFAGNLTGRTLEATIDVWAARHLQRLGYEGLTKGKPWRAQAASEPGVNALDFAFSQDAMRHAADKISRETGKKMNPDDLQAILWFAEKHHYENKGWTRGQGAEKGSFDDVADLAFPKSGEPMTSAELRAHYAAMQEAAAQRKARIKTAKGQLAREDWKRLGPYIMEHELTPEEVYGAEKEEEEEPEGHQEGGLVGYQRGGRVAPPAPGPTDTVPAMLTPGEFVVNRNAVQAIGPQKLEALNAAVPDGPGTRRPRGYQEGDLVTPTPESDTASVAPKATWVGGTVPRATFVAPPPGPPPPRATLAPGAANEQTGSATTYAGPQDLKRYQTRYNWAKAQGMQEDDAIQYGLKKGDNGIGAAALGTVNTANAYGVAIPQARMEQFYGGNANKPDTTGPWRTARAEVTMPNGQLVRVPIIDLGPGHDEVKEGKIVDISQYLGNGLGMGENDTVKGVHVRLLPPGSGPDYTTHPDAWFAEQAHIGNQFQNNAAAQIGAEPETTPWTSPTGITSPPAAPAP